MIIIDFENLGYKDITKDKPIHFIELIGEFFETTCPYNKRFYKQTMCGGKKNISE